MKTCVYIDGFNLYYGSLKGSSHRWLNVVALAKEIFPHDEIACVRYFTARVKPWPIDPKPHTVQRQDAYLKALSTLPNLVVHEGHYSIRKTRLRSVETNKSTEVYKSEEKGSDVNLASYLLLDGFQKRYERALVISNDSDLAEPITMVHRDLGLKIAVAAPVEPPKETTRRRRPVSRHLQAATKVVKTIRQSALVAARSHPRDFVRES